MVAAASLGCCTFLQPALPASRSIVSSRRFAGMPRTAAQTTSGSITRKSATQAETVVEHRIKRWRNRLIAATVIGSALLWPRAAWARTVRRVASRAEERQAGLLCCLVIALFFVGAYFNSKKEDSSEEERIKTEVQRLVRLKKEFEEAESQEEEGLDDDSMASALAAAQQKMAEDKAAKSDEGSGEGSKDAAKDGEAGDESKSGDEKESKDGEEKDGEEKDGGKQ
eukprot:TRINITY_DN72027_c0_g1_i1.p1 TRINITY_DN72027_c0_g1~~TRINITY_DN72027_c0_g1_i1.p1  ORF type:complete len:252 (+),score=70.83 TRINITY_DN72027_c0_g1_i1:83-757(+)